MTNRSSTGFAMMTVTLAMLTASAGNAQDLFAGRDRDPRIESARKQRNQIAQAERNLATFTQPPTPADMTRLRDLVGKMRPDSFTERADVLDEFKRVLTIRVETGKQLRQRRAEADESMRNYLQALSQAPAAFQAAADAIEQRAAKERLPMYREKQQKLADLVRQLAVGVQKQLDEAADFSRQFAEAWDHVDGQVNYVESLFQVVAIFPNPRDAAFSEKLRAEVDQFLGDVQVMDQSFQEFTQTLLKKAVSDAPSSYFHETKEKNHVARTGTPEKPKLPLQLPVLEAKGNLAAINASQVWRIGIGDTLRVIRGNMDVGTAVVRVVNPDSCVICRTDGARFIDGDQVRLPSTAAQNPEVARR